MSEIVWEILNLATLKPRSRHSRDAEGACFVSIGVAYINVSVGRLMKDVSGGTPDVEAVVQAGGKVFAPQLRGIVMTKNSMFRAFFCCVPGIGF